MKFNQNLKKITQLLPKGPFTLVDVGASGGTNQRWQDFSPKIRVVGFEPDDAEFKKLKNSETEIWLNTALSNSNKSRTLQITKSQSNTSFLTPNQKLLSELQWAPHEPIDDHQVVKKVEVQCDTLDHVLQSKNLKVDFMKLDTQGSELDILQGAANTLENDLLTVEVEVEFAPLYENQCLFADVDSLMRSKGFYLQDLGNFLSMKPRGLAGVGGAKGRLIAADALYVKDFSSDYTKIYELGEDKVYAAVVGYLAYGFPELGINLLNKLDEKKCAVKNSEQLISLIRKIKAPSGFAPVAETCGKIWYKYRQPEHCLWDYPLGNELN